MTDPIFVMPTWEYQSYSDLWRLVELSGYKLIRFNEMDLQSDNTYIFSTPSTRWHDGLEGNGFPDAKARVIYWDIEFYLDQTYAGIPGVEIWSADAWYAARIGAKYVPMGSHPALNPYPNTSVEKRYDVITLWADSSRRYDVLGQFVDQQIKVAPRGWGEERHIALLQSKAMCIAHQHEGKFTIAPQRWALAAAYSLPMITETITDGGIIGATHRLMSDKAHMGEFVAMWTHPKENEARLCDFGRALYQLLCVEKPFRVNIEAAL